MNQKAFTLTETLLYVSIVGFVLLAIGSFYSVIIQSQSRNVAVSAVDQNGIQVLEYLTQTIRNSVLVNSPAAGASATSLSINTLTAANNPTIFDLSAGAIRIKEGSATAINLTSSRLIPSNLTFKNLTTTGAKSVIKFQFTLTYSNPDNRTELNYSRTFYGTATLRQ